MKQIFLILALLLTMISGSPAACAQQRGKSTEPTLELTLGWIKEKINMYRDVSVVDVHGTATTETYEVTKAEECRLEIRHTETKEGLKVSTVYQLPLHDYAEFDTTNCQMFSVFTRGNSVAFVQQIEGGGSSSESSSGASDHVVVFTRRKDIDSCDLHKRLRKAFDHAAELCAPAGRKGRQ